MSDADFYRELASHCRALLRVTRNSELFAQLEAWAVECDRKADRALRKYSGGDIREQARRYEQRAAEYQAVAGQMHSRRSRASFLHLAQTYEAMARRLDARAARNDRRRSTAG